MASKRNLFQWPDLRKENRSASLITGPPIIGLTVAGRRVSVPRGVTVLSALQAAGHTALRVSLSGEPRGALCGMGSCSECRAYVGGRLLRTCLTPAQDGMTVELLAAER